MTVTEEQLLYPNRELHVKVTLLSVDDSPIVSDSFDNPITGYITSGSLRIDGKSDVRRTLDISFILNTEYLQNNKLDSIARELKIDPTIDSITTNDSGVLSRRFKLEIGVKRIGVDSSPTWQSYGIFVPIDVSFSKSMDSASISITAQDKMVLLNGDIAGEIGTDVSYIDSLNNVSAAYYDILLDTVQKIGHLKSSEVKIEDLPRYAEALTKVTDTNGLTLYYSSPDANRRYCFNRTTLDPYTDTSPSLYIAPGEVLTTYVPASPEAKGSNAIEASSKDHIAAIVKKVAEDTEGDFEYFFDVNGTFRFREKLQTQEEKTNPDYPYETGSFYYRLFNEGDSYLPVFKNIEESFSFDNKNIIQSFSNQPSIQGIKNDFYIHGQNGENSSPMLYHVVIGDKPEVKNLFEDYKRVERVAKTGIYKWQAGAANIKYNQPWQQYIIDLCDIYKEIPTTSSVHPSKIAKYNDDYEKYSVYYEELKKFFQYDKASNKGIYDPGEKRTSCRWRISKDKTNTFYASSKKGSSTITVFPSNGTSLFAEGKAITANSVINDGTTISKVDLPNSLGRFNVTLSSAANETNKYFQIELATDTFAPLYDINSISSNGTEVVYNVTSHTLKAGESIIITQATTNEFNGLYTVKSVTATSFTVTSDAIGDSSPARYSQLPYGLPTSWDYYFDIINPESLSQYSVEKIGRRVASSENLTSVVSLFPTKVLAPSYFIKLPDNSIQRPKFIVFKDPDTSSVDIDSTSFNSQTNSPTASLKTESTEGVSVGDKAKISIYSNNAEKKKLSGYWKIDFVDDENIVFNVETAISSTNTWKNNYEIKVDGTYRNIKTTGKPFSPSKGKIAFAFAKQSVPPFEAGSYIYISGSGVSGFDATYKVYSCTTTNVVIFSSASASLLKKQVNLYSANLEYTSADDADVLNIDGLNKITCDGVQTTAVVFEKNTSKRFIGLTRPITKSISSQIATVKFADVTVINISKFNELNEVPIAIESKFNKEIAFASVTKSTRSNTYTATFTDQTVAPYDIGDYIKLDGFENSGSASITSIETLNKTNCSTTFIYGSTGNFNFDGYYKVLSPTNTSFKIKTKAGREFTINHSSGKMISNSTVYISGLSGYSTSTDGPTTVSQITVKSKKVRYNLANNPYPKGDYINISGATTKAYNGRYKIIISTPTSIVVESEATGASSSATISASKEINFNNYQKVVDCTRTSVTWRLNQSFVGMSSTNAKIAKQPYIAVLESQISVGTSNEDFKQVTDAFTMMKNLIYTQTNFNEGITISCVPMYNLDVNTRVSVNDLDTNISGSYYINSIDFGFSPGDTMNISATKIYD